MRAKISPKLDEDSVSAESAPLSGSTMPTPFARYAPDSSSSRTSPDLPPRWVPVQESLLSEQSSLIWPKQGMWDRSFVYELPTSVLRIFESESSSSPLLPTPAANDDGKTPEQHLEMKRNLPGGPRYLITSLAVLARAGFQQPNLLPTPGANDATGGEGPTRTTRQQRSGGKTGGPSLRDIGHLLPTPTAGDAKSSGSRNLEGSEAHAGVSLTDAIRYGNSNTPRLLPTPNASHRGDRSQASLKRGGGRELRAIQKLLPTPTTGDGANNAGPAQHERNTLPLNTVASLMSRGVPTKEPSDAGRAYSEEPLPGQLTIKDA